MNTEGEHVHACFLVRLSSRGHVSHRSRLGWARIQVPSGQLWPVAPTLDSVGSGGAKRGLPTMAVGWSLC